METATIEQIDERLRELPPQELAVVLDFVSYLVDRRALREGIETALLSEPSLRKDWDTPEEARAWSHLPARRPQPDDAELEADYRAMTADEEREREALEWIEYAPDEALERSVARSTG